VLVGVLLGGGSGCRRDENGDLVSDDAVMLWRAAGCPETLEKVCPQRFSAPLAPHLAARAEGRELDIDLMLQGIEEWNDRSFVVVEGAGGLMSPMGDAWYVADLASAFGFPLLVVAPNRIGTINQTIQTLIAASWYDLKVAGVILNDVGSADEFDVSRRSNLAELSRRCAVPVYHLGHSDSSSLKGVDWLHIARNAAKIYWRPTQKVP
jgi:dethiobiotin synthetase